MLWLAIILLSAQVGGDIAARLGQPAVLGELLVGVVLGNMTLAGVAWLEPFKTDPTIDLFARLGVLLLLFEVGLESTVSQMLRVGLSSVLVAVLGVVAPFALGWAVGAWLLPERRPVRARVPWGHALRHQRRHHRPRSEGSGEVAIWRGAGDPRRRRGGRRPGPRDPRRRHRSDRGDGTGAAFSYWDVLTPLLKATAFLAGALAVGVLLSRRLFFLASKLRARGVLLAIGLSFCFLLSWLANAIGLAAIVGAFAAGLVLEDTHYREFVGRGERGLEELIHPISSFLAPVFFVLMGMHTDLRSLLRPEVLGLGGALIVAAIIGKQACSLGVLGRGVDRLTVGIGMIPRGEVGLIFANIGLGLRVDGQPVIQGATFSAVVLMVIVTTMITPPALKWSFSRVPGAGRHRSGVS